MKLINIQHSSGSPAAVVYQSKFLMFPPDLPFINASA